MMTSPRTAPNRPDFLIIGAMKCATSTVATYLEKHPDVDVVPNCEPRYFSRDDNYAKGAEWYGQFFDDFSGARLMGEGSNEYVAGAHYPQCAARIAADLPDVKLVMMVRHPIKRIVSAWTQYRADSGDFVPAKLDDAVLEKPDYLVDQSLYWKNLQMYRDHFADSQIFIGFMEDMAHDPQAFWIDLCGFLGIAPVTVDEDIHANSTKDKRVPNSTYSALRQSSLLEPVKKMLPQKAKRYLRNRVFSTPAKTAAQFSPSLKRTLQQQIEPDARMLLDHCNKPRDFWTFQ